MTFCLQLDDQYNIKLYYLKHWFAKYNVNNSSYTNLHDIIF